MATHRWTVDVESDWGGRSSKTEGIESGLPRIIRTFEERSIKAIFFISTELLRRYPSLPREIRGKGHEVGSHGHFHTNYKEWWRKEEDRQLSLQMLTQYELVLKRDVRYRGPKFGHPIKGEPYSICNNHVSVLKKMWLGNMIDSNSIIYLHPFDIVETKEKAPNIFCKLWYSRPKKAYETFTNLTRLYPDSYIAEG